MMPNFVGETKTNKDDILKRRVLCKQSGKADGERFYIRYKAEAMPRGVSIQAYCSKNNVPYNLFDNCKAIGEFI